MRIHTDTLTPELLRKCISEDERFKDTGAAIWRLQSHGSTKRHHAFEVRIGANAGKDINGKTRRPKMGGGYNPAIPWDEDHTEKALTYAEWGYFIANVYALDPYAIVGPYKSVDDFDEQTNRYWSLAQNGHEPYYPSDWAFYYSRELTETCQ